MPPRALAVAAGGGIRPVCYGQPGEFFRECEDSNELVSLQPPLATEVSVVKHQHSPLAAENKAMHLRFWRCMKKKRETLPPRMEAISRRLAARGLSARALRP